MDLISDKVKSTDEAVPESNGLNLLELELDAAFPFKEKFALDFTDLAATDRPVPRDSDKWRKQHADLVEKAKQTNPQLVFYGDSITAGMSEGNALKKAFGNDAENFGIVGDSTQHLLWRLQNGEANFKTPPEKGVLLIGANNVGNARNEDIVKGILADLQEAQQKMPDAKWLVLGVLPQGRSATDPRRAQIKDLNDKLEKALAGIPGVRYYDAGPGMLEKDGSMSDRVWWRDGLHPRNYTPMFDQLKQELNKF